jgi:Ulp1 family protease
VINPQEEAFEYYTSFANYRNPYLDTITNLLKASFPRLHPNIDVFKFEIMDNIPVQNNSDDCGIYMCYYIEQLLKGTQRENWNIDSAEYRCSILKAIYDSS